MSVIRIGVVIGRPGGYGDTLSQLVAEYEQARAADVSSVWMTQHLGFDALTVISSWRVDGDVEVGAALTGLPARGATDVAAIPLGNPDEVGATWDLIGAVAKA